MVLQLKNGDIYNLEQLITTSDTNWITPEWEFPKGTT